MKRKLSLLLIISLIVTFFTGAVPISAQLPGNNQSANQGYWQLADIEDEIPEDQSFEDDYAAAYKRYSYQQGQYAFDWGIENYDYEETITVDGSVSASFNNPPERIIPYETLTFNIILSAGHTSSIPADLEDEAVAMISFSGLIDDASAASHESRITLTSNSSVQDTVSVTFLPTNGMVFSASIWFELYGFSDMGGPMRTIYNYEWVEDTQEQPAAPSDINLRGLSLDMRGEPMPWMRLEAYVYYGKEEMDSSVNPDRLVRGLTDHEGRFHLSIPAADTADASGSLSGSAGPAGLTGILLMGYLTSYYPFAEDKELFRLIDLADNKSVSSESIRLATWILVNPDEISGYEPGQPIDLYRLLAFYHLALDTWSVDEHFLPEPVHFFTSYNDQSKLIERLEDYSILYTAAHQAWFFGGVLLDEKELLMRDPVKIMLNNNEWSHYEPDGNQIMLQDTDSKRDDRSIFTLMHEFGHYFDLWTNSVYNYRAASGKGEGDKNHGGYFNKTTSDSYMEGFATAYAGLVQLYSAYPKPEYMAGFVLADPPAYLAWGEHGKHEELAIAALLYQANQKYTDIRTFWSLISPDRLNFYQYYNAIHNDLAARSGAHAAWLRDFAIASGLYKMPFGNNTYDRGEPYLDEDGDGRYSPGERFADLMFDTDDDGIIDYNQPLDEYDADDLTAGKSSPANTPADQPRYTLYQSEDSFLYLNGESLDYALVRYYPDSGDAYSALFAVDNNRVYIPLGSVPRSGRVEVHVPGGGLIWQQDIAAIQRHKAMSGGAAMPLGEVAIEASQLYSGDKVPAATRGLIDHDGLMERPQMDAQTLVQKASQAGHTDLETLARERMSLIVSPGDNSGSRDSGSLSPAGGSQLPERNSGGTNGIVILLALLFLFLIAAAILLVVLLRKQTHSYNASAASSNIRSCAVNQTSSPRIAQEAQPYNLNQPADPSQYTPAVLNGNKQAQTAPLSASDPSEDARTAVTFCGWCGQQLSSADARFCRHCGHNRDRG